MILCILHIFDGSQSLNKYCYTITLAGNFKFDIYHIALLPACTAWGESGVTNEILMCTTTFKKSFPILYLKWNVTVYTGNNIFGESGVTVKLKTSNTKAAKHFMKFILLKLLWVRIHCSLMIPKFPSLQHIWLCVLCTVYLCMKILFLL